MNKITICLLLVTLTLSQCKKEAPEAPAVYQKTKGVFICNEGNFTYGNASLSFYDPATNEVLNQVFYNANSFPLGDVAQSMAIAGDVGFVVVNNSGKIFALNTATFKHIATITGFTSPRYIEFIDTNKAYVSDLYSSDITIIDYHTYQIIGSIHVGNSTERMLKYNQFVYVVSWSNNNKVYKINTETDKVVDSISVVKQPNSIVCDKNNKLWVLSDGSFDGSPYGQEIAALTKIDATTFLVEQIIHFPTINTSPTQLCINGSKDTLYFLNGSWASGNVSQAGVYKMGVNELVLPSTPIIAEGSDLFYGLGIDPITSEIYVSDAVDYIQKGWVYRYSSTGSLKQSFRTDIIPNGFCFK